MSLTFKLLSLAIRTAAKPIGNYIKRQAKEHDGFRRFAIAQAQRVHRIDMRMRLGILHDPAAQERMHEREQKAAEEKKRKAETPTVRNAEEQRKFEEEQAKAESGDSKAKDEKAPKIKIRPLSEAKAIELGANFFSEAFIFAVAAGLLVWDSWRSRRKESNRRDMVADRLETLEEEIDRLRSKYEPELVALKERTEAGDRTSASWYNPASWWTKTEPESTTSSTSSTQPPTIPGNVPSAGVVHVNATPEKQTPPTNQEPKKAPASSGEKKPAVEESAASGKPKTAG